MNEKMKNEEEAVKADGQSFNHHFGFFFRFSSSVLKSALISNEVQMSVGRGDKQNNPIILIRRYCNMDFSKDFRFVRNHILG